MDQLTEQQFNETFQHNWKDLRTQLDYHLIRQIRSWTFSPNLENGKPGGWMVFGEMNGTFALFFVDAEFSQHSILPLEEKEEHIALHRVNAIGYILAGTVQPK